MAVVSPRTRTRPYPFLAVGFVAIAGTLSYLKWHARIERENAFNFKLGFNLPAGWVSIPHSPQALFLYRDQKTHLLLRGAMSDIVSETNPMPELDRDGTAQLWLDITKKNLAGWKGEMLDVVAARGGDFRLLRRWNADKCVYSAVAVKGNTTVVVTLSADKPELGVIDAAVPAFKTYISTLSLNQYVYPT